MQHLAITIPFRLAKEEWVGSCPICQNKNNKGCFRYHTDGRFSCFRCKAHGRGTIDLVKGVKGCGFQEAVNWLQSLQSTSQAATPIIRQILTLKAADNPERTENPPFKGQYQKYAVACPWLEARGLTEATLKRFGVFCYNNPARRSAYTDKVMIPIHRFKDGELVAYLARDPRPAEERGEDPKYIFPKGFAKHLELFGAVQLKEQAPIRILYVVESAFSAMHFYQLGLPCVALLGWSVSPQQLDIIAQLAKGVCYLPDSDKRKEAQAYAGLLATKLWVKFPEMPVADPEHLDANQIRALTS